jgi:plasmid stabilization system protein ParE
LTERRVRFTDTARRHLAREQKWLLETRGQSETLSEELESAVRILKVLPAIGTRRDRAGIVGLRRVYLEKIGCHLYYNFDEQTVIVRALWGARMRRNPRFQDAP